MFAWRGVVRAPRHLWPIFLVTIGIAPWPHRATAQARRIAEPAEQSSELYVPEDAPDAEVQAEVEQLVARAKRRHLSQQRQWHRLLHYRPTLSGGVESEADGPGFFLAADGKHDPEAELEATLRGLFGPQHPQAPLQHPYCRFPARLAWLNAQLRFDLARLPQRRCEAFDEFLKLLEPASITLVFSSYYLNNPASAFGHTFLRVNKAAKSQGRRQELLDVGIDFSATVDTSNSLIYAFKGLSGMFPGEYRRLPYYYKVREYNDYESRDLWEYELSLSPEEVEFVVAHIWEMGSTWFNYYYMSENCSYHILGALEVANPRLELLSKLHWPVLPVDTIRAINAQPGLVKDVHYRPSNRTQFKRRVGQLSPDQRDALAALFDDANAVMPAHFTPVQARGVLDAALDLADVRFSKEIIEGGDTPEHRYKQRLLERRASIPLASPPLQFPKGPRALPHEGHGSWRFGLGEGYSTQQGAYYAGDFRLALHDLMDLDASYPHTFQLEFMTGRARYYLEGKSPQLEDFYPVRIRSYTPITRFLESISWRVGVGLTRLRDRGCPHCVSTVGELGGGGALQPWQSVTLWLTGDSHLHALAPIRNGIADLPLRLQIGPNAGIRIRFSERLIGVAEGTFDYLPFQRPRTLWSAEQGLRYSYLDNVALSLFGRQLPGSVEAWAVSHLYF